MKRDLRETEKYKAALEYFKRTIGPSVARHSSPFALAPHPLDERVVFDGGVYDDVRGVARMRLGTIEDGSPRVISRGPNSDMMPKWSPDGTTLAFLSDRAHAGRFQLYLAPDGQVERARQLATIEGTVEWFAWSPDSKALLVQAAGLGADVAGALGSGGVATQSADAPWLPHVEEATPEDAWRRLHRVDVTDGSAQLVSARDDNVWEAAWAGDDRAVAVVSSDPGESSWYAATIVTYDLATGERAALYAPQEQAGVPAATPRGRRIAFIEACCSDRLVVAGEITILDTFDGEIRRLRVPDVDVTHVEWRDEERLFCIGVGRLRVIALDYDVKRDEFSEVWSTDGSCGRRYPVAWAARPDVMYAVADSYESYYRIVAVRDGTETTLCDFAHDGVEFVRARTGRRENVTWTARDGRQIDGILVLPEGDGPFPLVVNVHGGPVWSFRNSWSIFYYYTPMLVANGYAVLSPNPRGSSGRGLDFQRLVRGDMCGEDTYDIITGVEALIDRGMVDAARVAVTGGSYGGYMSSWLVTQTDIFAAAIPMAPVTDSYSQHFTSNIGAFDSIFLDASPYESGGRFFERSPVFHARNARTPSLIMCGALDRCTPPSQALEFHRALLENNVPSELVVYPLEGHHINALEARADQVARMLTWLERYCSGEE